MWLVDEIKETLEVRTLRGDRYGDGELYAKGEQLKSNMIPAMTVAVTNIFED